VFSYVLALFNESVAAITEIASLRDRHGRSRTSMHPKGHKCSAALVHPGTADAEVQKMQEHFSASQ